MTAPAAQSTQLRCHHCSHWIGESDKALEFVGMFHTPKDREMIAEPRITYRCRHCGWVNIFRSASPMPASWRTVELKSPIDGSGPGR